MPIRDKQRVVSLLAAAFLSGAWAVSGYSQNPAPPKAARQTPAVPKSAPQKPAPVEKHSGYLTVDDAKIYYEDCGTGPAIVLLHDGLLHSVTWDLVWTPLFQKYHVVRYDRRGYGKSDLPKSQFSPTEDLQALLARLKIAHAVLVGSSSGAALAIDFALAHPEMTDGLFLIGPVVDGMAFSPAFGERGSKNNAPLAEGDTRAAAENWSKDPYIIGERHDAARTKVYNVLADNPQNLKYTGQFQTHSSPPASSRLGDIHAPTLILVGELDISDVHAHAGAIESGIAGAQRDIIINAGHLVQLEQPEIVVERLSRFTDLQARASMALDAATLQAYTGTYNSPDGVVTIGVEGDHLTAQMPGQPPFPLYAESKSKFFLKVAETEIEFTRNAAGRITQAIIYQDGAAVKAPRM